MRIALSTSSRGRSASRSRPASGSSLRLRPGGRCRPLRSDALHGVGLHGRLTSRCGSGRDGHHQRRRQRPHPVRNSTERANTAKEAARNGTPVRCASRRTTPSMCGAVAKLQRSAANLTSSPHPACSPQGGCFTTFLRRHEPRRPMALSRRLSIGGRPRVRSHRIPRLLSARSVPGAAAPPIPAREHGSRLRRLGALGGCETGRRRLRADGPWRGDVLGDRCEHRPWSR